MRPAEAGRAAARSSPTATSRPGTARRRNELSGEAGFEPALITVPAGETAKSLKTVQACYDQLAAQRLERKSFIVALGGGVVGDLAGFVAATYLRGIAFVQVPTTLLAQVDSSVGGKVGVNLKAGKNLVGAFYQPRLVLCDLDTLDTLAGTRVSRRAGRGHQVRHHLRRSALRDGWSVICRSCCGAIRRRWRQWWPAAAKSRRRWSGRTKPRAVCAPS